MNIYMDKLDSILHDLIVSKRSSPATFEALRWLIRKLESITPEEYPSPEFAELVAQVPTKLNDARPCQSHTLKTVQ